MKVLVRLSMIQLVWSGMALHTCISVDLSYSSIILKGKNLSYFWVNMVSLNCRISTRRWWEGTWYNAVTTYFIVFIWRYWGESQSQLHQMVSCLRFKPAASKVHVRSVNGQANLMSNSCQGDAIWHCNSLRSFLPQALHGLCAAPVTPTFFFYFYTVQELRYKSKKPTTCTHVWCF